MLSDHSYMAWALRLARRGLYTTDPNPRVGCVVVKDERVVGEGWTAPAGGPHAEIRALEQAGTAGRGATAYVTLEPCCHHGRTPPCTDALIAAGVSRVVIAAEDPNPAVSGAGEHELREAGLTVDAGVLGAESAALNVGFFQRMTDGRPFVRSKLAVSLDGRTALGSGESKWITGEAARADVQRWRARSSAILTGVGTVLADDPALNVRADELGEVQQPARLVLDSQLRMPDDARLLGLPGTVRLFCAVNDPSRTDRLESRGAIVEVLPATGGHVSVAALMRRLGVLEINEVLVEAGPTLNGALLQAGLIDELVVYMAGHILGDDGRGMFTIPALAHMADRVQLQLRETRHVGQDLRLVYGRG